MIDSVYVFFIFYFDLSKRACMFRNFETVLNCPVSPGESWVGSPLTPLVRLRGKWGCHISDIIPKFNISQLSTCFEMGYYTKGPFSNHDCDASPSRRETWYFVKFMRAYVGPILDSAC